MDDSSSSRPSWVPDWFPRGDSLKYSNNLLQLFILVLAAIFLAFHLFKGRIGKVTAVAAGAS